MYSQLVSVRGTVDLSPQDALNEAQSFLSQQGYTTMRRTDFSLTAERHPPGDDAGQNTLKVTVTAHPHPGSGIRINVRGNDREGVQVQQAAWTEWSENLPKRPEVQAGESGEQSTFCPYCGHEVEVRANFCPECGQVLHAWVPQDQPTMRHMPTPTPTTPPRPDESAIAWVVRGMGITLGGVVFLVLVSIVIALLVVGWFMTVASYVSQIQ